MPTVQPTFTAEEIQSEIWKQVPGYEGSYEISSLSRPRSLKTYHGRTFGHILRVSPMAGGYLKVTLSKNAKLRTWAIHILVARAFLGPPPEGKEVNHIDGNKLNNRADNLEYVTRKKNVEHAVAHGLTPSSAQRSETMKVHAARGLNNGSRTRPEAFRSKIEYHFMLINLFMPPPQFVPEATQADLEAEGWHPVSGFEDRYLISSLGRFQSIYIYRGHGGGLLSPRLTRKGRLKVDLCKDGAQQTVNIETLVAAAFLGPRPPGKEINHIDGNKLNNRVTNLEYVTHKENVHHAMMNGLCPSGNRHYSRQKPWLLARGARNRNSKVSDEQREEMRRRYATGTETLVSLGTEFGLHYSSVQHIVTHDRTGAKIK
jgi:hypothetical protein